MASTPQIPQDHLRRLEALLAALPAPLLCFDREGNPVEDFPPENPARGRNILDQMPDDAHADFVRRLRLAIDAAQRQQLRFVCAGRWFVADIVPLPAAARPAAAAVLLRDATDEKESASQVDKLAARNEAILRSAMDGFFVVGEDSRFLEVNEAFCRMTGYAADELLRMKISDLEVDQAGRGSATNAPRTGLHHFATAQRHKAGHLIQLEISIIVLRDAGRRILVGFARDVTERNRTEERIRQTKERFEALVARMPLGYVVWTPDFRVREWNPSAAAIFGYSAGEVLGRRAEEFIVPADGLDAVRQMWDRLLDGEASNDAVVANTRKDGEKLTCEWFNTVLYDSAGRLECVATLVRDLSERRRLETQLAQSQKLESLGILAGGVAHDFNNFLVGILGNAALALERAPAADADMRRHLQKIVTASQRASDLTRQMLAYSGGAAYDIQAMDLNHLIRELTDFLRAALPKSITLTMRLSENLPRIEADSGQIQQIIMNLLINAAEAIGDQAGLVTISTAPRHLPARPAVAGPSIQSLAPGEYVCLEVEDTGCGMPPETLARIFDPFFTTKFTGRGLGLAAIQGIVRAHRGAVTVTSVPSQGTKFTVLFPQTTAAAAVERPASAVSAAQPLPTGRTVLVIDDEEEVRDVVQTVLEGRGMRVLTAEHGARGIELFRQSAGEIDVVLLDMTMPGLGGAAVFRELLAIRPDARVILSSGYSEQEAVARFAGTRLAGFVQKPFTIDALVNKVSAALG